MEIWKWVHMCAGLVSNQVAQRRVGFPVQPTQTYTKWVVPSNKFCTAKYNRMVVGNVRNQYIFYDKKLSIFFFHLWII